MNLKGKNIVIFGLGVSGMGALRFLGDKEAVLSLVNRGNPNSWNEYNEIKDSFGAVHLFAQDHEGIKEVFNKADLVILSPGIPREHELLSGISAPIWSEIELAFQFSKAPIIAVTGTNGKTTTVSFLDHLFKSLGKRVFTGGNIGVAFCDHIRSGEKVDYILLELSSFQLESTFDFKPEVGVLLNIFPNHGERYSNNDDYAKAKFNITKKMDEKGSLIFDSGNKQIEKWGNSFCGRKTPIDTSNAKGIIEHLSSMFSLSNYKLPGLHNKINLDFCLEVLNSLDLLEGNIEALQKGIDSFSGVAHRIEYVPSNEKFEIYNDAKSTNWDATLTAIESMKELNRDLVLILGGKLRGQNDLPPERAKEVFVKNVKKVLLIGEAGNYLEENLSDWLPCFNKENIEAAVSELREENFGGVLLLSPAFPSFDQFSNYAKRGEAFKSLFSV
ncbi:MAG: UDP-N-acetylmuramoyl-L-alanine--D-glutamate ligase [Halobacteriovorax sp.]|nr:UDP-N-acetylmuramoyl-L-alanine--D-glutamate ligase [Halobacteriovorax sp.]|tara:strand:+ start:69613 stop:70941 length:1329 start_codon:yes stop_codon:yes gene_type:complete